MLRLPVNHDDFTARSTALLIRLIRACQISLLAMSSCRNGGSDPGVDVGGGKLVEGAVVGQDVFFASAGFGAPVTVGHGTGRGDGVQTFQ